MRKSTIALLLMFMAIATTAQTVFEKTFGSPEYDFGTTVRNIQSGEFIIACVINDGNDFYYHLLKTNANGDSIWAKKFNVYGATEIYKIPMEVSLDNSIVFMQNSQPTTDNWTIAVTKVDFEGSIIWEKTYPNKPFGGSALTLTSDTGCVVTWFDNSVSHLLKLNKNGEEQFDATLNSYWPFSIISVNDGYVMGGLTMDGSDSFVLSKSDFSGAEIWSKLYPGASLSGEFFNSGISRSNDGGYIMFTSVLSSGYKGYVLKFDSVGDTIWTKKYSNRYFTDGVPFNGESYIITGSTMNPAIDTSDLIVLQIDEEGIIQWQDYYNLDQYAGGMGVSITTDQGIIVAGYQEMGYNGEVFLIKRGMNTTSISEILEQPNSNGIFPDTKNKEKVFDIENSEQVIVYDMLGKSIYNGTGRGMDIRYLKQGIYIIQVTDEMGMFCRKVFID